MRRGLSAASFARTLLPFALVSQPIYRVAFFDRVDNILITLLLAGFVVELVAARPRWMQQAIFALGAVVGIASPWFGWSSGICFGVPGLLLPAAFFLFCGGRRYLTGWTILLLVGLNWNPLVELRDSLIAFVCVVVLGSGMVALSLALKGRSRFLPRYALHFFYPVHLLLLIALSKVIAFH